MRIAGLIGALLLGAASSALAADVRWVLAMGWRGDLVHQVGLPPAELPTVLACWPERVVRVEKKESRHHDLPSIAIVPPESL